jgi:hypothetical protein
VLASPAGPQIEEGSKECGNRQDYVGVFNWHPVEGLPFADFGCVSVTQSSSA